MDVNFKFGPLSSSAARSYKGSLASGFTLVELLITMTVMSILLGLVYPSFNEVLASTRLTSQVNQLVGSFHLARSEAAKRGYEVVVCKSTDGMECNTAAEWHEGWIVYADINGDRVRDADETIFRVQPAFLQGQTLNYRRGVGSSNYLTYRPNGFTRTNGTFTFCDKRGPEKAKAVILYKTGRARLAGTRANGDPLTCP